jgi:hypothetical protein
MTLSANLIIKYFLELLICKDDVDDLKKRCNTIVAQMEDKSVLKQSISTLWEHVSYKDI